MALEYLGSGPVEFSQNDHIVLATVRNEALRLPYFLAYYRKIGFDRYIFVDNASTDGTRELLLSQPDVFVFGTDESFGTSGGGAGLGWKHEMLDRYCDGHWVLVADADEILVWPSSENDSVKRLTKWFESVGADVLLTVLVDMYSDKPFGRVGYVPGGSFIDYCPFFDRDKYYTTRCDAFPFRQYYGGVRERLFHEVRDPALEILREVTPTMSKVPFLRWRMGQRFQMATHGLVSPMKLAPGRGALLHFKMFDDLPGKCETETARAQYARGGAEYTVLGAAIRQAPNHSFYDHKHSIRYEGTQQLEALGMLSRERPF